MSDELKGWLEANAVDFRISYITEEVDKWSQLWRPVIVFTDDNHAMLFKLTWL